MNIFPDRFAKKNPIHWLAFGLGSGLSPKAPGTFGTLAAIPFYLMMTSLNPWIFAAVVLVSGLIGIWICGRTASDLQVHDHGGIVWDEFVGFWITMIAVPFAWQWLLLGFILFRVFDILKPWPISYLDKKVNGGFGIMIDDVIAGVFANIILQIVVYFGAEKIIM